MAEDARGLHQIAHRDVFGEKAFGLHQKRQKRGGL